MWHSDPLIIHSSYYPGVGTWHFDPLNIHSSYYPGVGTWHSDPLLSWCRNVTLWSPTILVSERDTPIPYYYVSVRDTRSSTILVSERDTLIPSIFIHLTILVSERETPIPYYPGVGTWHSDPLLSWCRNVTLRSSTILVSEREILILYYPVVRTWHSDPLLSCCRNVTLRSPNTTCRFVTPDPLPSFF